MTIVMISCVIIPVIGQNGYHMTYTHSGQQFYWEYVENTSLSALLLVLTLYDTYKKMKKVEMTKISKP